MMRRIEKTFLILLALVFLNPWAWGAATLNLVRTGTTSSSAQVNQNEIFEVSIMLDTLGTAVNGFSIFLTFDDTQLEIIDQDTGTGGIQPFMSLGFLGAPLINRVYSDPGNAIPGTQIDYTELSLTPKSGSGEIARLKFRAKASSGSSNIVFDFDPEHARNTGVSEAGGSVITPTVTNFIVTIGSGGGGGSTPASMIKVSGDTQSGQVGQVLPFPFVVQVLDNSASGVSNVQVKFEVLSGGGRIDGSTSKTVTTDGEGKAQVYLTLGTIPGTLNNSVRASLPTYSGISPVTFYASAQAAPSQLSFSLVDPVTGQPGASTRVGEPFSLQIRIDTSGESVTEINAYVTYDPSYLTVQDQFPTVTGIQPFQKGAFLGGYVSQNVVQGENHLCYTEKRASGSRSGSGIVATMTFTALKPSSGIPVSFEVDPSSGRVTSAQTPTGAVNPILNNATVIISAKAEKLTKVSGDNQSVSVGAEFPSDLVVRATDLSNNPASDVMIRFEVKVGDAKFSNGISLFETMTDSGGYARVRPIMGNQTGQVVIDAKPTSGTLTPVSFTATATPGQASKLEKLSGDGQIGRAGEPLPEPFVVVVKDSYGNPIPGYPITFSVIAGGGEFTTGSSTLNVSTNSSGQAQATLILGSATGVDNNMVQAQSPGLSGSPVTFKASASAGSGHSISIKSGDRQTGTVGQSLPESLVVVVRDKFGNLSSESAVKFSVIAGDGKVNGQSSVSLMTDIAGEARVTFTLGNAAGTENNRVKAELLNGASVTFRATATPDVAAKLEIVSGDGQTGKVGSTLSQPLTVKLTDQYGNPVANGGVRYRAINGGHFPDGGTLTVVHSGSDGRASVVFTLGTTSLEQSPIVEAALDNNVGVNVVFKATVLPDNPEKISIVSGDKQTGVITARLPLPLVVAVTDRYGNPVEGVRVNFVTVLGMGSPETPQAITNDEGTASTYYLLGTKSGEDVERIEASISTRPDARVEFTASVIPNEAEKITIISGDGQVGFVNMQLSQPLVVGAYDRYGNPIEGTSITFKVVGGNGKVADTEGNLSPSTSNIIFTDENGEAKAVFILGSEAGEGKNMVDASITGTPYKVTFAATGKSSGGAKLIKTQGDGQTGKVDQELTHRLEVSARDPYGNIAADVSVIFEVFDGGGWLNGNQKRVELKTDREGKASVVFRLGLTVGKDNNVVKAWINGMLDTMVTFTASALPGDVAAVSLVSGDDQTGLPGQTLAKPLSGMLLDGYGNPISNEILTFEVVSGSAGLLTNPLIEGSGMQKLNLPTDSTGRASAYVRLGSDASQKVIIKAYSPMLTSKSIEFNATIIPDAPSKIEIVSGDGQTGQAGKVLGAPLVVRASDAHNNAIRGLAVSFAVIGGGGKLIPDDLSQPVDKVILETGEDGTASVRFILGDEANTLNEVMVTAADIQGGVTFRAMASPDVPSLIEVEPGQSEGVVGEILSSPLVVTVRDEHGNPTPGATVRFSTFEGNAALSKEPNGGLTTSVVVRADSKGKARCYVKLGTIAGKDTNVILVSPVDFNAPAVYFKISGVPGRPEMIEIFSGDNQSGIVGEELGMPLVVKVSDQYANLVGGAEVIFEVTAGDGGLRQFGIDGATDKRLVMTTDDHGLASVAFVLGSEAGEGKHAVSAKLSVDPTKSVSFKANGLPAGEAKLIKVSGDLQIGTVGKPVARPIVVKLTDKLGNPIPQAEINFRIDSGNASFDNARKGLLAITDITGRASAAVTLGTVAGEGKYVVSATPVAYNVPPVTFRLSAEADTPKYLYKLSGDNQKGVSGSVLIEPLTVLLLDRFNNPVPDAVVTFTITSGQGELLLELISGDTVGTQLVDQFTDGTGKASTNLKLGRIVDGKTEVVVQVSSPDIPSTVLEFREKINAPPVFSEIAPVAINEGEFLQVQIWATDPDDDGISFSAAMLPDGADFSAGANPTKPALFRWRPSYDQSGRYSITLVATDSVGNSSKANLDITVRNVNRAPEIADIDDLVAKEDQEIAISLEMSDPDKDPLTVSVQPLLEGMEFDEKTNTIKWTPGPKDSGIYDVTVSVSDSAGGLASTDFRITVIDVNHPPVVEKVPAQQVNEGETVSFKLNAHDPDGDQILYSVGTIPAGATFLNGTFTWATDYESAGSHVIVLKVSDGKNEVSTEVLVNVVDVNQPPVFQMGYPDGATVLATEGKLIEIQVAVSEPDGDQVTITAANPPRGSVLSDGVFSWTPGFDQSGEYSVTFIATDSKGDAASRTININVEDVNHAPVIGDIADVEAETGNQIRIEIDVTDIDGDEVSLKAHPIPKGASLNDHVFTWTPEDDQAGLYTITFAATDSKNATAHKVVKFTISKPSPAADPNGDGEINIFDIVLISRNFGATDFDPRCDINGDGQINILDLVLISRQMNPDESLPAPITEEKPVKPELLPNYPNPFNPETWIPFRLSDASRAIIRIYDASGRVIRRFDLGEIGRGLHQIRWDGRNESGEKVAGGVYFYELTMPGFRQVRKMLIVK